MTVYEAYRLYKSNALTQLNRQQYTVLEAYEHFLDSGFRWSVETDTELTRSLASLWEVASRI